MRSAILGAGLAIFTCCAAFGQAAAASPAFEVASVKPAEPQTPGQMRVRMSGGPGTPDFRATHVYECLAEERSDGRLRMVGNRQPVSALTEILGNHLGRPVVDATELKANYDFTVDFAPDSMDGPMGMMPPPPPPHDGGPGGGAPMAGAPDGAGGPTIFTALQEQLGLKLEQRKGPVDLLVIDRLEKVPTEN